LQVTLCDPYLSALDAFAWTRGRVDALYKSMFTLLYFTLLTSSLVRVLVMTLLVISEINRDAVKILGWEIPILRSGMYEGFYVM